MKESETHVKKVNYENNNKFNTILFWILGFCVAMVSSISLAISFEDTMHRISVSEMPENPVGFILGGIIIGIIAIVFHFSIYMVLLILTLATQAKIQISTILLKKDGIIKNIVRVIGYFIILFFLKSYFSKLITYKEIVISELFFYLSSILTTIINVIWICSFIKDKKVMKQ